jgi:hypothetical protein
MAGHIADAGSIHWCSPLWIPDGAHEVLGGIGIDPCGNIGSVQRIKAKVTLTLPEDNGLEDPWHVRKDADEPIESFYENPPFGTYYMHNTTREILLPKELKAMCEALMSVSSRLTNAWSDKEAKAKVKELRAQYTLHSIDDWRKKGAETWTKYGVPGIHLGPGNTDTVCWQEVIEETAAAILYIKGRVYFELVAFDGRLGEDGLPLVLATGPAPMACNLVYWGDNPDLFAKVFAEHGHTHILR